MSTRCNEQLTFDIPPYSAVAAKCARPLSANGTQIIVAITESVVMAQGNSEIADSHVRD
ncbi:MAG TPA: hypothetical protein VFC01_01825 [Mycobacterium sp.]|nr:hypothetical protein [Mycobacterium sp.]